MTRFRDTIFALSSGPVPSGVAVIRVSGPDAARVASGLLGGLPPARKAVLRRLIDVDGDVIDEGLALWFPGPGSFTGEDSLELQVHGSRAVLARLYERLRDTYGCRLAEAGEFTRRAFDNGKLDLMEVEGLGDLVAAETEMQRRLALEQGSGRRSALYGNWRERILRARAMLEAELDFADEEDIPESVADRQISDIRALAGEIGVHIANEKGGAIIRDGFKVAIVGAPNVGKSSFINHIARREIAIVSNVPGTTRDVVECDIDIDGYLIRFSDTAGIRETTDEVENIGISRALAKTREADLVLLLADRTEAFDDVLPDLEAAGKVLRIATKADLAGDTSSSPQADFVISTLTGQGVEALLRAIGSEAAKQAGAFGSVPARTRHVEILKVVADDLGKAVESWTQGKELTAEHLRAAASGFGRLAGRIDTEEVLGAIFSSFCIGK